VTERGKVYIFKVAKREHPCNNSFNTAWRLQFSLTTKHQAGIYAGKLSPRDYPNPRLGATTTPTNNPRT
jgi:hypothetical protein